MRSSKFRFAAYFALLALLPVLAASWAFSQVSSRGDTVQHALAKQGSGSA